MNSLLSSVPLRTTIQWEFFKKIEAIPHAYGDCSVSLIQYSENGQSWCISDGSISGIRRLIVDNVTLPSDGYTFSRVTDIKGKAISIVQIPPNKRPKDSIIAEVIGKIDPVDGSVIRNPAIVIWDFLNNIAGIEVSRSRLDKFRISCENSGIEFSGIIGNNGITNRAMLAELLSSAGAIGSIAYDDIASIYPIELADANDEITAEITRYNSTASSRVETAGIITTLNVNYGYSEIDKEYTRSLKLVSSTEGAFSGVEQSINLRYITDRNAAYIIGKRHLQHYSRPIVELTVEMNTIESPTPGTWVDVNHPYCPTPGNMFVKSSEVNLLTETDRLIVESPLGNKPAITITEAGEIFEEYSTEISTVIKDGTVTITARDKNGAVLPGAIITLDTQRRVADNLGKAVFSAKAGTHYLKIEQDGKLSFESDNYFIGG